MTSILKNLLDTNNDFKKSVKHRIINVDARQTIIKENDQPTLFLITSGRVKVSTRNEQEQGITSGLADISAGETIGEFSLFDDHPATADVIAVLDTELVEFDKESLLQYFNDHPELGYQVLYEFLQSLGHRLRAANKAVLRMVSWGIAMQK